MRLWSIHPRYLDCKGLLALWREGLLAQKVLEGGTSGYRNHPQLIRFIDSGSPAGAIGSYLEAVYNEALRRGYNFDPSKINAGRSSSRIRVPAGQVSFEIEHLRKKLMARDMAAYREIRELKSPRLNPVFIRIKGGVEDWEKDVQKETGMSRPERIPLNKRYGSADVPERLRVIDCSEPHAVLATMSGGSPYTSLVAYRLTPDLKGILFATPRSTRKYRNILKNREVSILMDTRSKTKKDYMNSEAVTATGTAKALRRGRKRDELAVHLIKKHPELKEFINAPSTALVLVEVTDYMHVSKFQETTVWKVRSKA